MSTNDRIREAVERLAAEIARAVRDELRADEMVDQYTSPLGRRRHLEAARRGAFPVKRQGRLVFARRSDVDAYLATPRTGPRARSLVAVDVTPEESVDDLLASLNITTRRAG